MNFKSLPLLSLFALVFLFFACEQEHKSIEKNEFTIQPDYEDLHVLNLYQNKIKVEACLIPEQTNAESLSVKVFSNADPVGFEKQLQLEPGSWFSANTHYNYVGILTTITAANHTNAERGFIKVSDSTDLIRISIGENLFARTIPINCKEVLLLTYWNLSNEATVFLYGHSFKGTETKTFSLWTSADPQLLHFTGTYSNPQLFQQPPPFTNYSIDFGFSNNGISNPPDILGISNNNEKIFVIYNDKTYWSDYKINTFEPLDTVQ